LEATLSKNVCPVSEFVFASKNEYSSNCLTRLVVDESKFEQKRRDRKEEVKENEEQRRMQTFKDSKRRPDNVTKDVRGMEDQPAGRSILEMMKIKRKNIESIESKPKRRKLDERAGMLDLGFSLRKGEERCLRAGNLKLQLAKDKDRMMRRWECLECD
jgi:hypothetical protein